MMFSNHDFVDVFEQVRVVHAFAQVFKHRDDVHTRFVSAVLHVHVVLVAHEERALRRRRAVARKVRLFLLLLAQQTTHLAVAVDVIVLVARTSGVGVIAHERLCGFRVQTISKLTCKVEEQVEPVRALETIN